MNMKAKLYILVLIFLASSASAFSQGMWTYQVAKIRVRNKIVGDILYYRSENLEYVLTICIDKTLNTPAVTKELIGFITGDNGWWHQSAFCDMNLLMKRNKKNNWVIVKGPGLLLGMEFSVTSMSWDYDSNLRPVYEYEKKRNENYYRKQYIEKKDVRSLSSGVFGDGEGYMVDLLSNGKFYISFFGIRSSFGKQLIISSGNWMQEGNILVLKDKKVRSSTELYVISQDTLLSKSFIGGRVLFTRSISQ